MTGRPPTLEHVARAAGVSRATVSRALSGTGPVSTEVLRRVRAAAEALGYVADPVARALANGAGTRVVVAVTGDADDLLDCAYTAQVVTAGARVCAPQGLGVAVTRLPLRTPVPGLQALARDRTVAGVVLVNATRELLSWVPAALRGRVTSIGVGGAEVPAVDVDAAAAAGASVAHLVRAGRRRIAMVTGPPWLPCTERPLAAYRAAVTAAGLPVRVVPGGFDTAAGEAGAEEVLARWPDTDAVLASCDDAALGVLGVLRRHGRQVPGDVAVVGFDDVPLAGATGLTTATHPVERIAAAAVAAALTRTPPGATAFFRSELVVRRSA